MGNYEQLKAAVSNVIKTNGTQAITGQVLQNTLLTMINGLGRNYQFVGIAATNTNPGTPDQNVFYIAGEGTYTNFANISVNMGELAVLKWNGAWSKQTVKVGLPPNELNVSTLYPTSGEGGTNKYTLSGAIAQVPAEYRTNVGLKITFINNETTKPETWVYNGGTFTTSTNWTQGSGSGGNKILDWNTDVETTRKRVVLQERKAGMQISYLNPDKGWVNEQYIGTTFTDTEWAKDSNWNEIATKDGYEEAIENIKVTPSMTTFMDGNVESIFDNIENSQLIAENSALSVNVTTKEWSIIGGSNRIYKIPIDGAKNIYYNKKFTTNYPKMYELDRKGNFLDARSFSRYSNVSAPKAGAKAKFIVFELEKTFEPSEFWMSYVDLSSLGTTPQYNVGYNLFYRNNWKSVAEQMIASLMKDYFLPILYEKTARYSLQQNNIAKIIIGRYNNGVQVAFAKGYIYILKSIPVNTIGAESAQAPDYIINALNEKQYNSSMWGYFYVLAIDKDGNIAPINDTLIEVRFGYSTEVVIRENTNHIYVVGDSLSDATFSTYSMSYIAKLKAMYAKIFNFVSYKAIYGYKTLQEYNVLKAFYNETIDVNYGQFNNWQNKIENYQVTADRFKGFSIYIGTNDIAQQTDLATFTSTYTEMIAYIKERFTEANIFVIVPPKCNKKANAINYCNAIKTICDGNSIDYVDLSVINELDSTKPDYNYSDYYLEVDCIHFNQAGWDLINALVIPKFAEVMQDKTYWRSK